MRERKRTLQRLLAVKSQLHKIEEAKLDEIQRRKVALEAEQRDLLKLLGDEERNDPFILGLACRHLFNSQSRERDLIAEERESQSRLFERAAQKKALEKGLKETTLAVDRENEKLQLLDIGERLAGQSRTSLP
jgi:hypothetical protein